MYIESSDFRRVDAADYYGLAPGKSAGLRHVKGWITVVNVVDAPDGSVSELQCSYEPRDSALGATIKAKGNLSWVGGAAPGLPPLVAEVRLYGPLFTTEDPGASESWESELNPASEVVVPGALVDSSLVTPVPGTPYQFERSGYYIVDKDSDAASGKRVFNLVVGLREDSSLKSLKA